MLSFMHIGTYRPSLSFNITTRSIRLMFIKQPIKFVYPWNEHQPIHCSKIHNYSIVALSMALKSAHVHFFITRLPGKVLCEVNIHTYYDAAYSVLQRALFMAGFYVRPKVSCVPPYDVAVLLAHMQYAHLHWEHMSRQRRLKLLTSIWSFLREVRSHT